MPKNEPLYQKGDTLRFTHPLHGEIQAKVAYIENPGILVDDEWNYVFYHEGRQVDALEDEVTRV